MKKIILVVVILFGFSGCMLGKVALFPAKTLDNEINTGYDAVDKTINADNAIYNYEWFKQQKEDIDASKIKLDNAKQQVDNFKIESGERKDWTFEDKNEYARLNSVYLGLNNYLTQQIADYNARAKMANRNIFMNGILPDYIEATTFIFKN